MEAIGGFVSFAEAGQDTQPVLGNALGLLRTLGATAVQDAALWGFRASADFADDVEELSRTVEYLQLVAAEAVDRTRNQAAASAGAGTGAGWLTGWKDQPGIPAGAKGGPAGTPAGPDQGPREVLDDGFRNTTDFLRARLRISAAEARRRLALAGSVLPGRGLAGQPLPAVRAELGAVLASGTVASRAATIITVALDRVRHTCDAAAALEMERALTRTAAENDPDFLARIARRWTDALDQDGAEPSDEALRHLQGAFIRRTRHGLHHLEIFATADQFEHLLTVMNTATNPRTSGPDATEPGGRQPDTDPAGPGTACSAGGEERDSGAGLDRRSRPQKLLDGLVGACKIALASGSLPAAGGLRPQVMVTIGYRDLLDRLGHPSSTAAGSPPGAGRTAPHTGTLPFTGPVTAATVRKIACDADIIPVLLGGEGRILDIGRAARIFPPHIRKAITARDQGCAFPQCTIPAPWCEAHHISYWSRRGTTSTENGTLLCSHHHHLVHKEQWTIQNRAGIPWFIPPPHVDPRQLPRRNHYFRLE